MNLITTFLKKKVQDIKINQSKPEVQDTYIKDEKKTTNFEPTDNSDVINQAYLDEDLSKIEFQISYIEKDYTDFKKHNKEDCLVERAVVTTIEVLYEKGVFDNYKNGNADELLKDYLLTERRRPDLEESKRR